MQELRVTKVFSRGVAIGPIFRVEEAELKVCHYRVETAEAQDQELRRFAQARELVQTRLAGLAEDNPIFAGHLAIVSDFTLEAGVKGRVQEGQNAEEALEATVAEFAAMFEAMDDAYMQERAADIRDVGEQLLAALQNRSCDKFEGLNQPSIIVARDLFPSDTARLDLTKVLGFITEEGGVTSHVSIMAKSLGIPSLVGAKGILEATTEAQDLAFDAETGEVYISPDAAVKEKLQQRQSELEAEMRRQQEQAGLEVITRDGRKLKVYANVGTLEDIRKARELSCDGVGLFRTEFLYMENDHFPTEEEQYAVYKAAAELLPDGEIIIRTLDIGGDKCLSYFQMDAEENPFLGFRAIRLCLQRQEILRTQFRAILRAGVYGKLRIMLPMLISLEEADKARRLFEDCQQDLRNEGLDFAQDIPFGMMMETPASVLMARDFAQIMDFFSIGTNDLTQYVLAVDRGNKEVKDLYNPYNPAVLRAIAQIIEAGHEAGIEVGMCGEFASDPKAAKVLLGLGLDEFSMSAPSTARVKELLRESSYADCQSRARELLKLGRTGEIESALKNF